ncbi:MAG: carbohydrate kinase family protein [Bacillota bacterium]|nr:carbohydrate kinase family protein [Bacillota bacterium]
MKKILCIGSLIVDIINSKIERLPREGESTNASVLISLGGNAFSMSVNLSRLNQLDFEVFCYGQIGQDCLGELFEVRLRDENVLSCLQKTNKKNTSCNIIIQEKGKDRRYIFDEGANSFLFKGQLINVINNVKPDVVVFGEIPSIGLSGNVFLEILDFIKKQYNSLVLLDLLVNSNESYNWLSGNWHKIDIIHCNKGEGAQITKNFEVKDMVKWFVGNGIKLAIISDGQNGCCCGFNEISFGVDAFKAEEIDATGAGDAMVAGIITRILEVLKKNKKNQLNSIYPYEMKEIIRFGSACGAIAIQALGCISDITRHKVEDLLESEV